MKNWNVFLILTACFWCNVYSRNDYNNLGRIKGGQKITNTKPNTIVKTGYSKQEWWWEWWRNYIKDVTDPTAIPLIYPTDEYGNKIPCRPCDMRTTPSVGKHSITPFIDPRTTTTRKTGPPLTTTTRKPQIPVSSTTRKTWPPITTTTRKPMIPGSSTTRKTWPPITTTTRKPQIPVSSTTRKTWPPITTTTRKPMIPGSSTTRKTWSPITTTTRKPWTPVYSTTESLISTKTPRTPSTYPTPVTPYNVHTRVPTFRTYTPAVGSSRTPKINPTTPMPKTTTKRTWSPPPTTTKRTWTPPTITTKRSGTPPSTTTKRTVITPTTTKRTWTPPSSTTKRTWTPPTTTTKRTGTPPSTTTKRTETPPSTTTKRKVITPTTTKRTWTPPSSTTKRTFTPSTTTTKRTWIPPSTTTKRTVITPTTTKRTWTPPSTTTKRTVTPLSTTTKRTVITLTTTKRTGTPPSTTTKRTRTPSTTTKRTRTPSTTTKRTWTPFTTTRGPQPPLSTTTRRRPFSTPAPFKVTDDDCVEEGKPVKVPRPDRPKPEMPTCALSGKHFCILTDDYPEDVVNRAVDKEVSKVRILYEELQAVADPDLFRHEQLNRSVDHGSFACETESSIMRPGWAQESVSGDWMVVVNTDLFPQKVRTESCKKPNEPCEFVSSYYESTCQQRYSLHRLLAVYPHDPNRSPVVALFKFPAGCSCRVDPVIKDNQHLVQIKFR